MSTHFAEEAVLSACFLGAEVVGYVRDRLTPGDFDAPPHQTLYRAILATSLPGKPADPIAVVHWLEKRGELAGIGGHSYVADVLGSAPTDANIEYHVPLVLRAADQRRVATILADGLARLEAGDDAPTVDEQVERQLTAFRQRVRGQRVFDDKQAMATAALAYLDETADGGTPFGFAPWDGAALPPLPGHLVLLGGASGSGKSTVARNLVRQVVQRYGRTVGWLTCEMTGEEQLTLLACIDAGIAVEDYYRRRLTEAQRREFAQALAYWRDTPRLLVNEMGAVSPEAMFRIFRRWRDQGVTHFVLDHLHRLNYGATKSGDDLRIPVAAAAKGLKDFAKDHEATVYALVQYTKIKPHEEPDDSKIREANQVLEESDSVFHIYRPLVACERDTSGRLVPLVKDGAGRYFEGDAPKGAILAHDSEYVYVKLGKQRRRLRDGLVRVPFNPTLWCMYDTKRALGLAA